METIILAGGEGTRLRSVVSDRPKPLANVNGRPFLEYVMDYLILQNCSHFVLATRYKGTMIKSHFGDNYKGIKVSYSEEVEPLGTGGAILNAHAQLIRKQPFLVMNGDTFFNINLRRFRSFAITSKSDVTIALFKAEESGRYGATKLTSKSIIQLNNNKRAQAGELANGGMFFIKHDVLKFFTTPSAYLPFEEGFLPALKNQGAKISGLAFDDDFIDIGIPKDYHRFGTSNTFTNKAALRQ